MWRDASGNVQLDVLEAKAWGVTSRMPQPNDLTALGMRNANIGILAANKSALVTALRGRPPNGIVIDSPDWDRLLDLIDNNQFAVVLGHLPDTRLDKITLRSSILSQVPGVTRVDFERLDGL